MILAARSRGGLRLVILGEASDEWMIIYEVHVEGTVGKGEDHDIVAKMSGELGVE